MATQRSASQDDNAGVSDLCKASVTTAPVDPLAVGAINNSACNGIGAKAARAEQISRHPTRSISVANSATRSLVRWPIMRRLKDEGCGKAGADAGLAPNHHEGRLLLI